MTKIKMVDYAAWSLLASGYICSATFLYLYGNQLGWLTVPPETKQTVLLFDLVLFIMILGIAATRPKRIWLSIPLMLLLSVLVLELTKADCIANICVVAI